MFYLFEAFKTTIFNIEVVIAPCFYSFIKIIFTVIAAAITTITIRAAEQD